MTDQPPTRQGGPSTVTAQATRPQTKPFAQFVQEQRRGLLHAELSDALADVVAAVMKHGKKGSLTVKFEIKPEGDDAVSVSDKYDAKAPTPPAKASLFFADEAGQISRQRLNQPELPLRAVDGDLSTPQDGGPEAAQA